MGKKRKPKTRSRLVAARISGLRILADRFNRLEGRERKLEKISARLDAEERDQMAKIFANDPFRTSKKIVEEFMDGEYEGAIEWFNRLAQQQLHPRAEMASVEDGSTWTFTYAAPVTKAKGGGPDGQGLECLYRYYFADNGWVRLKRCPQCQRWFVDDTEPNRKERCSPKCTNSWWNEGRRREAGHRRQKAQSRRKRKSAGQKEQEKT